MTKDIFGQALIDYSTETMPIPLYLHSNYGDIDEMPIDVFFREEDDLTELEDIALALCDGKVLDVGAGAGTHTLYLQNHGFEVTALEISDKACQVMASRGISDILNIDFYRLDDQKKYDTLLFMMNGIGIAGTYGSFITTLRHCQSILAEGGQLLFDSSDINYLYTDFDIQKPESYYGEIEYQYEYNGEKGQPFKWLYLDQQSLINIAREEDWVVQILYEDDSDQYLARMEKKII